MAKHTIECSRDVIRTPCDCEGGPCGFVHNEGGEFHYTVDGRPATRAQAEAAAIENGWHRPDAAE